LRAVTTSGHARPHSRRRAPPRSHPTRPDRRVGPHSVRRTDRGSAIIRAKSMVSLY
jgi:hypothetical protein